MLSKKAQANILKRLDDFGEGVGKAVKDHISKNMDVSDPSEEWIRKNVSRLRVKKDGTKIDISNKSPRGLISKLNPLRKEHKIDVDLDSGKFRSSSRNKGVFTDVSQPANKPKSTSSGWKKNVKKILGIGAAGAGAGAGGAAYMASGSEESNPTNSKKEQLKQYVRQKRRSL